MKSLFAITLALAATNATIAHPATKKPAKAATAPARDWSRVASVTPQGHILIGNPKARVKVVEFLSFTCPHCAAFAVESHDVFKGQMIRSGSTSLEYRPVARDLADTGITLLLRCIGKDGFADTADEIFARQPEWLSGAFYYLQNNAPRYALRDPVDQIKLATQASGVVDILLKRGMPQAKIDACLSDKAAIDRVVIAGDAARSQIEGTPSFVINGQKVQAFEWSTVEPLLRTKGAR